jgi:hypothetical protein
VVDRKNLPNYEPLTRRVRATTQNQFAKFTEKELLYRVHLSWMIAYAASA